MTTKFKLCDLVKVKGIRGPKMVVGSIHNSSMPGAGYGVPTPAYSCGWFDKNEEWRTALFNENSLVKA